MQLSSQNLPVQSTTKSPSNLVSPQPNSSSPVPSASVAPTNSTVGSANLDLAQQGSVFSQTTYGHFPYKQADPKRMIIVASYATEEYQRFESVDPEAGKALMKMIYAARDEGVWIILVSGFRTIKQQQKLFQEQIKRRGSPEAAAKVSAPSGYSEHHTGFAVDLADGQFPKQDITYQFENTAAYRWLTRRAKEFGFEMSFSPNNAQGVSFEPWHWRYVGSPDSAAIFANARNLR
ncbi:M15 family metallopeptidase [Argonema antarcticum]|uniref:M15 family metallopeptidase n=1 Tax=Argonema antarcticum TaxID=2942763 RepID=UPI0020132974